MRLLIRLSMSVQDVYKGQGVIPVLVIARQVKVNLSRLQLGLLYTKEISVYTVKRCV